MASLFGILAVSVQSSGVKEVNGDSRILKRVDKTQAFLEMNKCRHQFKFAQLGPRFPPKWGESRCFPHSSLLAAIDDDFRQGRA